MKRAFVGFAAVLALSTGLAFADELIYFTNGSAMPIQSHEIKDKTIHVVLGANATMAFPIHLVDRIERAGISVFSSQTLHPANQVASSVHPGSPVVHEVAYPQDGSAGVPARFRSKSSRRGKWMDPAEQMAQAQERGKTDPGTAPPGRAGRNLRVMGRPQNAVPGGPVGTYRQGDHYVLDASPSPQQSSRGNIVGISIKPGHGSESAPPPPADGEGSGSEGQSPPPSGDQGAGSSEESPPESE